MPNLQIQMTKKVLQSAACCYKYLRFIFIFANEFDSIERFIKFPSNEKITAKELIDAHC